MFMRSVIIYTLLNLISGHSPLPPNLSYMNLAFKLQHPGPCQQLKSPTAIVVCSCVEGHPGRIAFALEARPRLRHSPGRVSREGARLATHLWATCSRREVASHPRPYSVVRRTKRRVCAAHLEMESTKAENAELTSVEDWLR